MIDEDYIKERYGELTSENVVAIQTAMDKYRENHWWESKDPLEVAMYQIFEEILLVKFDLFHKGIEKLLDRPVFTHEFGLNYKGLEEEVRQALSRLKSERTKISDEERKQKIIGSIGMLERYCEENGKSLFYATPSDD